MFGGFAGGSPVGLQQTGFGLVVAVAIDAAIVRSVLVPATMKLLGDRNWYLPAWLHWLPEIHIEGPHPRVDARDEFVRAARPLPRRAPVARGNTPRGENAATVGGLRGSFDWNGWEVQLSRRSRACACATESAPNIDTDRVVTLVHGTFARHADWVQDDSPLASELDGHAVVDRFCWTGKNRHRDRLDAGSDLRAHLVDLINRHRTAGRRPEHHVIAHSHGGNVALYALRPRGDQDDETLADVKLITLATPFLTMQKRDLPRFLFVLMGVLLLGAVGALGEAAGGSVSGGGLVFSLSYGIFGVGAFVAFVVSVLLYRKRNPVPVLRDLVLGHGAERDAEAISAPEMEPDRLLVMRGLGDEAAGLLGAAQLSSWGMSKIANRLSTGRLVRLIGIWLLVMFGFFLVTTLFNDSEELTPFENTVADGSGLLFAIVVVIAIVTPGFIVFANLPFGLDTLFWNFHARTTADPVPLGGARILQVRQRDSAAEITEETSHSLYDDPPAVRAMVASVLGEDPFEAANAIPVAGTTT